MNRFARTIAAIATGLVAACSLSTAPAYQELGLEARAVLTPGPYYDIALLDGGKAAIGLADESDLGFRVDVVDLETDELDTTVPVQRQDCLRRIYQTLTKLPDGRLGFADVCSNEGGLPTRTVTLVGFDHTDGRLTSLGGVADLPTQMAWTPDMRRLVYSAGTHLCQTIYVRTETGDGPMDAIIAAQGQEFPIGEDILNHPDRCTDKGTATAPAINGHDGSLAVLAAATGNVGGAGRLDLPWSVVLVSDGRGVSVFDGIYYPGGLAWVSGNTLIFAGEVLGQPGMWLIARDGTRLRRASSIVLAPFSYDARASKVIGLMANPGRGDGLNVLMKVGALDLASVLE